MSKDEIAYRIRLMFYSIFGIVFAFLFIAISSYLQLTETAGLKQTDQIKLNIIDGLKVREKVLFEEFSTNNLESIKSRINKFLESQRIENYQIYPLVGENCHIFSAKICEISRRLISMNSTSIESMEMLGEIYISLPMQGWGEPIGTILIAFPKSEISATPTFFEKICIYILPFVLLGFLVFGVFSLAEARVIRPTIKRIIETEKIKAQQSIIRQFAHDIKSPIVALETVLEVSQEADESKTLLSETISRIKEISSDLLEWDSSFIRVNEVDIRKLLESIISEKTALYKTMNISVAYEIDETLKYVLLNKIEFYRAVSNLLNNSIESATSAISIKISVSYLNANLHVSISDNGPGIPPEKIQLVLDGEYSSKNDGHGLGVSGAKNWVEKMNGVFDLESNVGLGTTVRMIFPASVI